MRELRLYCTIGKLNPLSLADESRKHRDERRGHPFLMATHIPEEVSRQASQRDLGELRECYTAPGARLFCWVFGGAFLLCGLVMVLLAVWGDFTPGAALAGYCCMLVGALFVFIGFLSSTYCTYEYDGGLIDFDTKKHKVIHALRWSEMKSTDVSISRYSVSYFVTDTQGKRFLVHTQRLWKRCREMAARNYERSQIMTFDADEGIYAGNVKIKPKRFSTELEKIETIAVQKQIYEEELARKGQEVELSAYWLPRYNGATVYFRGKYDPSVTPWILEGKQVREDVPPDALPTLEQMKTCMSNLFNTFAVQKRSLGLASFDEEAFRQRLLAVARRQNRADNDPDVRYVLTEAQAVNKRLRGKKR